MKREERELFDRQQALMESLCDRLDRQHIQNSELILRLQAIYNLIFKQLKKLFVVLNGGDG